MKILPKSVESFPEVEKTVSQNGVEMFMFYDVTVKECGMKLICFHVHLLENLFSLHFSPQCLPTNKGSPFARKLFLSLMSHWQFVKLNKVAK